MTERTIDRNGIVVERRVNVTATIAAIPPGEVRKFERRLIGSEITVRTIVNRANSKAGRKEYTLEVADDTFTIMRHRPTRRD